MDHDIHTALSGGFGEFQSKPRQPLINLLTLVKTPYAYWHVMDDLMDVMLHEIRGNNLFSCDNRVSYHVILC